MYPAGARGPTIVGKREQKGVMLQKEIVLLVFTYESHTWCIAAAVKIPEGQLAGKGRT